MRGTGGEAGTLPTHEAAKVRTGYCSPRNTGGDDRAREVARIVERVIAVGGLQRFEQRRAREQASGGDGVHVLPDATGCELSVDVPLHDLSLDIRTAAESPDALPVRRAQEALPSIDAAIGKLSR